MKLRTLIIVATLAMASEAALANDAAAVFEKSVLPVVTSRCAECHGGENPEANLDLSGSRSLERLRQDGDIWFRALAGGGWIDAARGGRTARARPETGARGVGARAVDGRSRWHAEERGPQPAPEADPQ
jgi:hypothetical protein